MNLIRSELFYPIWNFAQDYQLEKKPRLNKMYEDLYKFMRLIKWNIIIYKMSRSDGEIFGYSFGFETDDKSDLILSDIMTPNKETAYIAAFENFTEIYTQYDKQNVYRLKL
jgi:hypothetical protein